MKKLLILLLVLLVGFPAFANPAQLPGEFTEAVMAEYGIHEDAVTQPSVLALPIEQSSFLTVASQLYAPSTINFKGRGYDTGQPNLVAVSRAVDYYLLL